MRASLSAAPNPTEANTCRLRLTASPNVTSTCVHPPSAEFAAKRTNMKKNASASHKTAAAVTAGSEIGISALAHLGGIRYVTSISAGLGMRYGLSPEGPVWDRLEVFDLLWAVRDAINGRPPARWEETQEGLRCRIDFNSCFPGGMEPEAISVVATLNTAERPGRLHLALADEAPHCNCVHGEG